MLIKSCAPNSNTAKHSSYSCFFIVDDAILQDNISCNISGVVIFTETNKNLQKQDFLGNRVNKHLYEIIVIIFIFRKNYLCLSNDISKELYVSNF